MDGTLQGLTRYKVSLTLRCPTFKRQRPQSGDRTVEVLTVYLVFTIAKHDLYVDVLFFFVYSTATKR